MNIICIVIEATAFNQTFFMSQNFSKYHYIFIILLLLLITPFWGFSQNATTDQTVDNTNDTRSGRSKQ